MEFIRTIREKQQTKRENDIQQQAEECITLSDFDSNLYIAYNGTPLVPIEETWTPARIVQELSRIRSNYVNAKMKNINRSIAMF